ncbi:MAG TPA: GDSL-type esterase/lipase family protein, partial [Casimicrobiaceae bacterium]|nr:GDSL-type esterase/lipase family protein [Casimicrobiaceae bacterium]
FEARRRGLASDGKPRIVAVAEGDSWFDYPLHFDLLDLLQSLGDVSVWRVSHYGHTLQQMQAEGHLEETLAAVRNLAPDVFLLSCGGNDIMGCERNVFDCFLCAADTRAHPADPYLSEDQIQRIFHEEFAPLLESIFKKVLEEATKAGRPDLRIFMHGYDYGFPDGRGLVEPVPRLLAGPWLAPPLHRCGYFTSLRPTLDELAVGHAAIKELIDYYNRFLQELAEKRNGQVIYVDLRGTLSARREHWANETHPSESGFGYLGRRLNEEILRELNRG